VSACANSPGTADAQAPALVLATRSTLERRGRVGDNAETARLILQGLLERKAVVVVLVQHYP
jgi:uncharacterized membrane-anchored protein